MIGAVTFGDVTFDVNPLSNNLKVTVALKIKVVDVKMPFDE